MNYEHDIILSWGQLFLLLLLAYITGGGLTLLGGRALKPLTDRGIFVIFSVVTFALAVGFSIGFDWTLYGSIMAALFVSMGPMTLTYLARKGGDDIKSSPRGG